MTIKQFIEKAREGGCEGIPINWNDAHIREGHIARTLLNPLAWQAVGKAEGGKWSRQENGYDFSSQQWGACEIPHWKYQMHRMIDHLAEASQKPDYNQTKAIEQFLETL